MANGLSILKLTQASILNKWKTIYFFSYSLWMFSFIVILKFIKHFHKLCAVLIIEIKLSYFFLDVVVFNNFISNFLIAKNFKCLWWNGWNLEEITLLGVDTFAYFNTTTKTVDHYTTDEFFGSTWCDHPCRSLR